MRAEIRYLLAASGATINDNREAINDATMMSATSGLVQEDPMPTRAGSYLAALLRDAQAPRTQAGNSAQSGAGALVVLGLRSSPRTRTCEGGPE